MIQKEHIYILRTHFWNDALNKIYKKMQNELGESNVFILFDDTGGKFQSSDIEKTNSVIITTDDGCRKINKLHRKSFYNIDSQLYFLADHLNNLRIRSKFIWLIEYDIICNGNWLETLSTTFKYKSDFMGYNYIQPENYKKWPWWNELSYPVKQENKRGCWFPITRISNKLLNIVV